MAGPPRHARAILSNLLRGLVWGLALWLSAGSPASAHHDRDRAGGLAAGAIAIPSLSHGQMSVIADNLGAIRELADRQFPTDPAMRKLQGFINLQTFMCLWGVVPGSLDHEDSAFNECTHAYLAAARALLLHLDTMPGPNHAKVGMLRSRIDVAMLAHNASLILCRFSGEPFSTDTLITPRWQSIPLDPLSILKGCALLLVAAGSAIVCARRSARLDKSPRPASSGRRG